MSKGGASPRLKGDRFEVDVVKDLERHGWDAVRLRQGGGENIDVLAVQKCANGYADHLSRMPHVRFIQCRLRGRMLKAEKEALKLRAQNVNAEAYLAYKRDGEIVYEEIRDV